MNKYSTQYNQLMAKAAVRELLGRIPKPCTQYLVTPVEHGGTVGSGNIVQLTVREKLLANRLLVKF